MEIGDNVQRSSPSLDGPLSLVLDRLRDHGSRVKGRGRQWHAQCSGHEDRNPSLSVTEAADGNVLVKCHAGCETNDVLAPLGLTVADLFAEDGPRPRRDNERDGAAPLMPWLASCRQTLVEHDAAQPVRDYLASRGVTDDEIRRFGLGVGVRHEDDRLDSLRARLVFAEPPHTVEGRVVPGLEGRSYHPERKYHTPRGFRKRAWGLREVDPELPVVLVEGLFDRIAVERLGQAFALRGSSVQRDDVEALVSRGVQQVLVCLDPDRSVGDIRKVVERLADGGLGATVLTGVEEGDLGDLLRQPPEVFWPRLSEALTVPLAVAA